MAALLGCCASLHWARRLVDHRPYPDLEALLAAADEAAYDLCPRDLTEALGREALALPPGTGYSAAAHTALSAAHAAYESRFGHVFVICLDGFTPAEALDQVLSGIRSRLGNDEEEERVTAAEQLRRIARGRLARHITASAANRPAARKSVPQRPVRQGSPRQESIAPKANKPPDTGQPDSPYASV